VVVSTVKKIVPNAASSPAQRLFELAKADMDAVDALVIERMQSPVGLIPNLAHHLVGAGGKRLRPLLTVATAELCGYTGDKAHHMLAAAVEFIHSATLLHDDVVDESAMRRGQKPANLIWGNSASILVGDFLFARAFNLMVEAGSMEALSILSTAASVITEGEVQQLAALRDIEMTEAAYMSVIKGKTAELFAAATEVAPVRAFKAASPDEKDFWQRVIVKHEQEDTDLERAISLLRSTGALASTLDMAKTFADEAQKGLDIFPPSPIRDTLKDLVSFVVERVN